MAHNLRHLVLSLDLPEQVCEDVMGAVARHEVSEDDWPFLMINFEQFELVWDWLSEHSRRPNDSLRVWPKLLGFLRPGDTEIHATREEIADRAKIRHQEVSTVMGDLAKIGAVRIVKDGKRNRYFLNIHVSAHSISKAERDRLRRETPAPLSGLRLVAGE